MVLSWCHDENDFRDEVFTETQVVCIRKATLVAGFDRLETPKKFQEILRIPGIEEFETNKKPRQSVDIQRRLRNFTVHLKSSDSKTFLDEATKL